MPSCIKKYTLSQQYIPSHQNFTTTFSRQEAPNRKSSVIKDLAFLRLESFLRTKLRAVANFYCHISGTVEQEQDRLDSPTTFWFTNALIFVGKILKIISTWSAESKAEI